MSTLQVVAPAIYDLTDAVSGNKVYYDTRGPDLWYGPQASEHHFTADKITTLPSPLGTLVTVTLPNPIPNLGRSTLTMVVPNVNMGDTPIRSITTIASITTEIVPIGGQYQFNAIHNLSGHAQVG